MKPSDGKLLWGIVAAIGVGVTLCGLFGIFLQGWVNRNGFPSAATKGEVAIMFTWPVAAMVTGCLMLSAMIFASPFTSEWLVERRLKVFVLFGATVLGLAHVAGWLAANQVSKLLN